MAQKEPAFAGSRSLWAPRGRSRLTPARAGSFFGRKGAGFSGQKPAPFLARKKPAFAGLRRLLPWRPRFCHQLRVRHLTGSTSDPARLLNDVIFEAASRRPGGFCGKHSYGAQRKRRSCGKPAFAGFLGLREAGFCRLCQKPAFPARRGLDYLR